MATLFRSHGAKVERQDQSATGHDHSDLVVEWPEVTLRVECKDRKTLPPKGVMDAYAQASSVAKTGERPILVMHIAGTSREMVCLEIADFLDLVKPPQFGETCAAMCSSMPTGLGEEPIR